jgi:hypothetical protein
MLRCALPTPAFDRRRSSAEASSLGTQQASQMADTHASTATLLNDSSASTPTTSSSASMVSGSNVAVGPGSGTVLDAEGFLSLSSSPTVGSLDLAQLLRSRG